MAPVYIQQSINGTPAIPDQFSVSDKGDPSNKKIGLINKNGPIVQRDLDPSTGAPYPLYYPRTLAFSYTPIDPLNVTNPYYFVFAICKNRCKSNQNITMNPSGNMISGSVDTTDENDNYAAVGLISIDMGAPYNSITIEGSNSSIDLTSITPVDQ